jgi:hypothetical protein
MRCNKKLEQGKELTIILAGREKAAGSKRQPVTWRVR